MANFGKKAQGALEYLLIIGGAVVLAAIVIAIIFSLTGKTSNTANDKFNDFNNFVNDENIYTSGLSSISDKAILIALGYDDVINLSNYKSEYDLEKDSIFFASMRNGVNTNIVKSRVNNCTGKGCMAN